MKRFLAILSILAAGYSNLHGQVRGDQDIHYYLEGDVKSGIYNQNVSLLPLTSNYANAVNPVNGKITLSNPTSFGYNLQFGYYFGERTNFAVEVGLMYLKQEGNLALDTFHVEYKSQDYKGNTFRQVISARNGIHEAVSSANLSIPVLLRYKLKISKVLSMTFDGGLLINTMMQNSYTTDAKFDYEAIYQFQGTGSKLKYLYDASPKPGDQDWLITKAEFAKDNPKGNLNDYFTSLRNTGFNVGLNQAVTSKSGKLNYRANSLGYMFQSAVNVRISKIIILKVGGYYISQSFANKENTSNLMLTNGVGSYNSLLHYTKSVVNTGYGGLIGIGFVISGYHDFDYEHPPSQVRKF